MAGNPTSHQDRSKYKRLIVIKSSPAGKIALLSKKERDPEKIALSESAGKNFAIFICRLQDKEREADE